MLISDRDGVLLDTCKANLDSYTKTAETMGLATNIQELEIAIHSGAGIVDFSRRVWGELTTAELNLLRSTKSEYFIENIANVRVNHDFIESFLVNEKEPYLVTRASVSSTKFLVDHFGLDFFGKRIISASESASKIDVFNLICANLSLDRSQVTIVDDSPQIISASTEAGFHTIQYPHFCLS
jgi:beta-phosphoglucomutase-like phosphatase (HAD superfamily)